MSLRKAAKHFGIAVSTLADKVNVPRTLLTQYEEQCLFQWLVKMSELSFGQTTDDVRRMAKAIIELRGGTTSDPVNMPSTSWVYRFFERHGELTLRTPMSLGKERALVTPPNLEKWFQALKTYVDSIDPSLLDDPSRIFNADESGFSFDPKYRKVITEKGAKTVYTMSSNTKTQVTVLVSMSAAGFYLPPLLIYPYKRIPGKNLLEGFPEALLQVSDNGWITSAIFFSWLRDSFIPATAHLPKPILLLVDGHVSHKSLVETSEICEQNGIILFCLLAHASHLTQPLDQAFFGSLKSAWSTASRHHIAETGNAVGLETFAKVFKKCGAALQLCLLQNPATGLLEYFLFSPERVLHIKNMMPCQVFRDFVPTSSSTEAATGTVIPTSKSQIIPPLASHSFLKKVMMSRYHHLHLNTCALATRIQCLHILLHSPPPPRICHGTFPYPRSYNPASHASGIP